MAAGLFPRRDPPRGHCPRTLVVTLSLTLSEPLGSPPSLPQFPLQEGSAGAAGRAAAPSHHNHRTGPRLTLLTHPHRARIRPSDLLDAPGPALPSAPRLAAGSIRVPT